MKSFFWEIEKDEIESLKDNRDIQDDSFFSKSFLDYFPIAAISNSGGIFLGAGVTELGIGCLLETSIKNSKTMDRLNLSIEEWVENFNKSFFFKAFDGHISPVTLSVYHKSGVDSKTIFSLVIKSNDFIAEKLHASMDSINVNEYRSRKTIIKNLYKGIEGLFDRFTDKSKKKDYQYSYLEEIAAVLSKEVDYFIAVCRKNGIILNKILDKKDVVNTINECWLRNEKLVSDNIDNDELKNLFKKNNNLLIRSSNFISYEEFGDAAKSGAFYLSSLYRPVFEGGLSFGEYLRMFNKVVTNESSDIRSMRILIVRPYIKIGYDKKPYSNSILSIFDLEKIRIGDEILTAKETLGSFGEKKALMSLENKMVENLYKNYECIWNSMREEWQEAAFNLIPGSTFIEKLESNDSLFKCVMTQKKS